MVLVDEQIHLQKILQENASLAQEEAKERIMQVRAQRKIVEILLKEKESEQ